MQPRRRTAIEALSREQREFLKPPPVISSATTVEAERQPLGGPPAHERHARPKAPKRTRHASRPPAPQSDRPEKRYPRRFFTQPVTLRLQTPIATALRRAAMERSLEYIEPFTQQEIVENAVRSWLEEAGYWRGDS